MTRCQITIRTSLSAFKEIDFIFIEKKRAFDSQGVWWKKRRRPRNKVMERKRENGSRRLRDKMKRWEVIASIIEKKGKDEEECGAEGGRRGSEILKSHRPALKGHLWSLCSCACPLWTHSCAVHTRQKVFLQLQWLCQSFSTLFYLLYCIYIYIQRSQSFTHTQAVFVKCEHVIALVHCGKKMQFSL